MFYNYYQSDEYQYDQCVGKGICSIDPTVASLQEVIIMYLRSVAFYLIKLKDLGAQNESLKKFIINILAQLASNPDYSESQFQDIIKNLYNGLLESKTLYIKLCKEQNIEQEVLKDSVKATKYFNYKKIIHQGEKEFVRKYSNYSNTKINLLKIIFILIKSTCIKMTELYEFGEKCDNSYYAVLELLNLLNHSDIEEDYLKKEIDKFTLINYEITKKLENIWTHEYGEKNETDVSKSTRPGKAILVSGSNLKELELLLESVKNTNIDVYTHGENIISHTYPKFREYKNLQGQFGLGLENFLLDYATFPGPILMTKHSLQNIEYLYRGRLFTTDTYAPKGVQTINNYNFKPLIQTALESKGFRKGRPENPIHMGWNKETVLKQIENLIPKIKTNQIKHIFLIGISNHTIAQKEYFQKFLKITPKNAFIISLSYNADIENILHIDSCFDFSPILTITETLAQKTKFENYKFTIFLTKCDKNTFANILTLKHLGVENIYLSKCSPIMVNPTLIEAFKNLYNIQASSTPKNDLDTILRKK